MRSATASDVLIGGIMEHIEQAGRAFGRLRLLVAAERRCRPKSRTNCATQTRKLAQALNVVGLMNIQFAIQSGVIYILEVNPRASRTVPFVSKATGMPLAKVAARVMAGKTLAEQGHDRRARFRRTSPSRKRCSRSSSFPEADPILGPEMKSTGEVMGTGETFGEAYAKAQAAPA